MKRFWMLLISLFLLINVSNAVDVVTHTSEEKQNGHESSTTFVFNDDIYHYYKCKTNGCTKVFGKIHSTSDVFIKYDEKNHYYKCNEDKCSGILKKPHNFSNQPYHKRECTCDKCKLFFKAQPELKGKHWQYCSDPNCFAVNVEFHTGGTHDGKILENGKKLESGQCETCYGIYQTHAQSSVIDGYNEKYCWRSCSFTGCTHKEYFEHVKDLIHTDMYRHWFVCTLCQKEFGSEKHVSSTDFKSDISFHWQYCTICNQPLGKELHTPDQGNTCSICREHGEAYEDNQIQSFTLSKNSYTTSDFNTTFTLKVTNVLPKGTTMEKFYWNSSNPDVATVNENGVVTIHETLGTTIITATALNGVKAECAVYVGDKITLNGLIGPKEMVVGDTAVLTPTFTNAGIAIEKSDYKVDYSVLEWSTNSEVVELIDGFVIAKEPSINPVTVTVKLQGGSSKTLQFRVICQEIMHKGGIEHDSGGKCTECGTVYLEHKINTKKYYYDDDNHWNICSGCESSVHYNEEKHSGGSHSSGGKCKCGFVVEEHAPDENWKEKDKNKHACGCIAKGCSSEYTENHIDANKDGKCDKCRHQQVCGAGMHTGGSHENGGVCTDCGTPYENHYLGEWQKDEKTHWKQCTAVSCNGRKFAEAQHTFVNEKCSVCSQTEPGKCGEHKYRVNIPNHLLLCTKCNPTQKWSSHKYINGKCECGRTKDPNKCDHPGFANNLVYNETHHWYTCPNPISEECYNYKYMEAEHEWVNDVCSYCHYNRKTGKVNLDYELRVNVYQTEYYIDKEWVPTTGDTGYYKYIPTDIEMDIVANAEIKDIVVFSRQYDNKFEADENGQQSEYAYDYLTGKIYNVNKREFTSKSPDKKPWLKIEKKDNILVASLTEDYGAKTSQYFEDRITIRIRNVNKQETEANIRIIKAGEERARFHADVLLPIKSLYTLGEESGEFTIRARTSYLYGNSSEEEIKAFEKLDKTRLGKYILENIEVRVNHINTDAEGNAIQAVNAEVLGFEELIDENGFPFYDIRIGVKPENPGSSVVVVKLEGQYQGGVGDLEAEFKQTRTVTASMSVFKPIEYTPINSGNSGAGGSSGGDSGSTSSGNVNSSSGNSSGNAVGGAIAGIGVIGLLALFILGKKMSGH